MRNVQQWQQQQASDLQQRNHQHQQRFLLPGGESSESSTPDDGNGKLPENWGQFIHVYTTLRYIVYDILCTVIYVYIHTCMGVYHVYVIDLCVP